MMSSPNSKETTMENRRPVSTDDSDVEQGINSFLPDLCAYISQVAAEQSRNIAQASFFLPYYADSIHPWITQAATFHHKISTLFIETPNTIVKDDWKPLHHDTDDESGTEIDENETHVVRFSSELDICEVERIPEEDWSNYWISAEEFGRHHRNTVLTYSQVSRGQISLDEESFSPRGLELWNEKDAIEARSHRMTHYKRVRDEMELQNVEGLTDIDWESLHLACRDTSDESAGEAVMRAKMDEEEAKRAQTAKPRYRTTEKRKSIWNFETKLDKKKRTIKLHLIRKGRQVES
jgi:hypothetical protein